MKKMDLHQLALGADMPPCRYPIPALECPSAYGNVKASWRLMT